MPFQKNDFAVHGFINPFLSPALMAPLQKTYARQRCDEGEWAMRFMGPRTPLHKRRIQYHLFA
jgi:hypothetical protein